jgi:hypothetical protein
MARDLTFMLIGADQMAGSAAVTAFGGITVAPR